jgi:hypothetical protein
MTFLKFRQNVKKCDFCESSNSKNIHKTKLKLKKGTFQKSKKVPGKPLSIKKRFDRTKGREMEFGSYWIVQHAEFKKRVKRTRWNGRISKRYINVAIDTNSKWRNTIQAVMQNCKYFGNFAIVLLRLQFAHLHFMQNCKFVQAVWTKFVKLVNGIFRTKTCH